MIITRAFQNHQPYLQARQLTAFCCLCSSIGTKSLKKMRQKTIFILPSIKLLKTKYVHSQVIMFSCMNTLCI